MTLSPYFIGILVGLTPGLLFGLLLGFKISARKIEFWQHMYREESKLASALLFKCELQEKLIGVLLAQSNLFLAILQRIKNDSQE